MPIRRRPLGRALTAVILLAGHAAASQSQTTPRAAPAESGYRHPGPGWQASGFRGASEASVPHSSTGHVASEAAPTTGAPAPRESRGGGSSQSLDPIPINTYHMGPRPQ